MADVDYRQFLTAPSFSRPIIVVYGSDHGTVDGASRLILQSHKRQSTGPWSVNAVQYQDVAAQADIVFDFLGAPSLFGDIRALHVSAVPEKAHSFFRSLLDRTSRDSSTDDLVLFSSDSLRRKSKTLDLFRNGPASTVLSAYESGLDRAYIRRSIEAAGCGPLEDDALALLQRVSTDFTPTMFDSVVEKILLNAAANARITAKLVSECLPTDAISEQSEILEAILHGSRSGVLKSLQKHLEYGGEPVAFAAQLGRQFSDILSKRRAPTRGAPALFWKTEKLVKSVSSRIGHFDARVEQAAHEIHRFDHRSRQTGALSSVELERTLLRICKLFET